MQQQNKSIIIREVNIANGKFLDGFLTSPATAAILVTPAYESRQRHCG